MSERMAWDGEMGEERERWIERESEEVEKENQLSVLEGEEHAFITHFSLS